MRITTSLLAIVLGVHALQAHALNSDRDQPATIEADEVEFDFRTGKRTYIGNVLVVQGTLRITGDKMVIHYEQNSEQIETATSWGAPATFKQRPDGKEHDVYGEGDTIEMNQIRNTLTLIENATMTQAGNTAKGQKIVYDMSTDKMTVKGLRQQQQSDGGGEEDGGTGRARVIITPEEQSGATDAPDETEEDEGGDSENGADTSE